MAQTITYELTELSNRTYYNGFVVNAETIGFSNGDYISAGNQGPSQVEVRFVNTDGNIFTVNTPGSDAAIAELANGRIIVTSTGALGATNYAIYNRDGSLVSSNFTGANEAKSDVAGLASGRYVIVSQQEIGVNDHNIMVHLRSAAGAAMADFAIDGTTADDREPVVAALADGGFAVAWHRVVGSDTQGWTAVYNADGSVRTAPFQFIGLGTVNQGMTITALDDGGYAVGYQSNAYGGDTGIVVSTFDASGGSFTITSAAKIDGEILSTPAITQLSNGMLLAGFTENFMNLGALDIMATLVDPDTGDSIIPANLPFQIDRSNNQSTVTSAVGLGSGQFAIGYNDTSETNAGSVVKVYQLIRRADGDDANDVMTGDDAIDEFSGGNGNDTLSGGDNNDRLFGNLGDDIMRGGAGDDLYEVESVNDKVIELANEGIDTIGAYFSYTLGANVENLLVVNMGNLTLTGNTLANQLIGNDFNNVIDGKQGADMLAGGKGHDTYLVDNVDDMIFEASGEGTDTVQSSIAWTLGDNLEKLVLTGTRHIAGTGNALNNTLTGNDGDNVLDGGSGSDKMSGGKGNDTYVVERTGDTVTEAAGEGADTVKTGLSYTLGDNVENLILTGNGNVNGTGNALDNVLTGNDGNNTLNGLAGADTMSGGKGDDIYVADNAGDKAIEKASEGTDLVRAGVDFTLGANIENLTLTGTADIDGTGNTLGNTILGNAGANLLNGLRGADILTGGGGADVFAFDPGFGKDEVTDFVAGTDKIAFDSGLFADFAAVQAHAAQVGADTVITYNSGNQVTLDGVSLAGLQASDFMFV